MTYRPFPKIISPFHIGTFWSKVSKTETCWIWTGTKNKQDYGVITIENIQYIVSRLAYYIQYTIDPQEKCVLHTCDTPNCIRKEHLYLGDKIQNTKDRMQRNRGNCARGEQSSSAIFTENNIREIRQRVANGETMYSLAKLLNVSHSCISLIVRRKRWTHID